MRTTKRIDFLRAKYSALWEAKWAVQREADKVWGKYLQRVLRIDSRIYRVGLQLDAEVERRRS